MELPPLSPRQPRLGQHQCEHCGWSGLPAPPPAPSQRSPVTQATDVAVWRPPGGRKLPPRLVLHQGDRDDARLPDTTLGTRCLSHPSSERTRRSSSLLLGGGAERRSLWQDHGLPLPRPGLPSCWHLRFAPWGLQLESEYDILQDPRPRPGCASHSAPSPQPTPAGTLGPGAACGLCRRRL